MGFKIKANGITREFLSWLFSFSLSFVSTLPSSSFESSVIVVILSVSRLRERVSLYLCFFVASAIGKMIGKKPKSKLKAEYLLQQP